jgi:hypothetical protein
MSGIFSPNSNVLDKEQHFRIILNLEARSKKIKRFENNSASGLVRRDFKVPLFPFQSYF